MSRSVYRPDSGHDPARPHVTPEELREFLFRWGDELAGQVGVARQGAEAIIRGHVLDGAMMIADAAIRASQIADPAGLDLAARLLAVEACRQAALGKLRFDFVHECYVGAALDLPGRCRDPVPEGADVSPPDEVHDVPLGPIASCLTPAEKLLVRAARDEGIALGLKRAAVLVARAKWAVNSAEVGHLMTERAVCAHLFNRLAELEDAVRAELDRTPRSPFRKR
jgi:hypothetical protein